MAFARTAGLRDGARFRALIDAGHVTATWAEQPGNGARFLHVSAQDRKAVQRRFVAISTFGAEKDLPVPKILALLKAARVHPISPRGEDFGRVYLRSEAETVFRRKT